MGHEAFNNLVIGRAFSRLRKSEEDVIRDGMVKLAKAGLEFLLEAHNAHGMFMFHTTEDNTMAYAVSHDGKIVASGMHNGGDSEFPGKAQQMAEQILKDTTGWVAIILSEMEGYYRVDYEEGFLFESSFATATEFRTFFKPIV